VEEEEEDDDDSTAIGASGSVLLSAAVEELISSVSAALELLELLSLSLPSLLLSVAVELMDAVELIDAVSVAAGVCGEAEAPPSPLLLRLLEASSGGTPPVAVELSSTCTAAQSVTTVRTFSQSKSAGSGKPGGLLQRQEGLTLRSHREQQWSAKQREQQQHWQQ
jgi:hypothetical protein